MIPPRKSKTRSKPLPEITVLAVPLPTTFTLSVMSKSPVALVLSPLARKPSEIVPLALDAKLMVSVPGFALAWLMAQRSDPVGAGRKINRVSAVVLTV